MIKSEFEVFRTEPPQSHKFANFVYRKFIPLLNGTISYEHPAYGGKRIDVLVEDCSQRYTVAFEIKSSPADMKTKFGKNFVAELNYLICPIEYICHGLKMLLDIGRLDDVGIIAIDMKGNTYEEVKLAKYYNGEDLQYWHEHLRRLGRFGCEESLEHIGMIRGRETRNENT